MKAIRIALWALTALAALGLGALTYRTLNDPQASVAEIGGPFTLTATNGETVTRDDILGRPHAVFFGYTLCPDVCPTSMYEMGRHMDRLGDRAEDLGVVFITVDPERDTPDLLNDYLSAFDERIIGLTGDRDAVDEAVRNYRAYYKIHDPDENGVVLVDHTASILLFDETGRFTGTIAYGEDLDVAYQKLERLIDA